LSQRKEVSGGGGMEEGGVNERSQGGRKDERRLRRGMVEGGQIGMSEDRQDGWSTG